MELVRADNISRNEMANVFDALPAETNVFDTIPAESKANVFDSLPVESPQVASPEEAKQLFSGKEVVRPPRAQTIDNAVPPPPDITGAYFPIPHLPSNIEDLLDEAAKKVYPLPHIAPSASVRSIVDGINFMQSPAGIALATLGTVPAAGRAIAAAFGAQAIKNAPEKVQAVVDAKTPEESRQAQADLLNDTIMGLGAVHALSRPGVVPKVSEPIIEPVTPKETPVAAETARNAEKLYAQIQPTLQKLPGDTQDKVRLIIEKQGRGEDLSLNEQATLNQVTSYASKTAAEQTPSQFTSSIESPATTATEAQATQDIAAIPSSKQGGTSDLFKKAVEEKQAKAVRHHLPKLS